MTTLTTIQSSVKLHCGGKNNIDSEIDRSINSAIYQFVGEIKPQEMWTEIILNTNTVTATPEYAFNTTSNTLWGTGSDTSLTDLYHIIMVRDDTDDVELLRGGMNDYNRVKQDITSAAATGDPRRWARNANRLVLYSLIPNTKTRQITMTYLKRPTALSAGTDTFPLNEEWEAPVILLASSLVWTVLNQPSLAAMKKSHYRDMLVNIDKPESAEDASPESQLVMMSNLNI